MCAKRGPVTSGTQFQEAINIRVPSSFGPPRPEPPTQDLRLFRFLAAPRTNALQIWSRAAYDQDAIAGRALGRERVLINTDDAIHRILVEHGSCRRAAATIRILRPIMEEGLILE